MGVAGHEVRRGVDVVVGRLKGRVSHVTGQVGQHRGDIPALGHPPFDVGVREVMPEVIRPGTWPAGVPWQCGLVPDPVEDHPDRRGADLGAGRRDEERSTAPEVCPRHLVTGPQDCHDLAGQREPATAVALGGDDVQVPTV